MKTRQVIGSVLLGFLLATGGQAAAAPCSNSDVTFNGSNADDCRGPISGNDSASNIGFTGFSLLVKDDDPGSGLDIGLVNGVFFTLRADDGKSGDWVLSWFGNLPITLDLVAVIKGGSSFSSYLFDNLTFTSNPSTGEGTFEITFLNGGGKIPDLSHLTLYWANAGGCCSNQVPEPGTLGMLALGGLALLGFSRRRPKITRG